MLHQFLDVVLHLDMHLNEWILNFGPWIYVILFGVIFAETGLVVTPFLPGDSLLFALGALTVTENAYLNLPLLCVVLVVAAILGDAVNYAIGRIFGEKLFSNPQSKFFRREHLERTHAFYEKHGGKTIVLARFMPIVRTFAPFVAGMGRMTYGKFALYNIAGGIGWVLSITLLGAMFGNLPSVKSNFHLVVLAIIVISVLPIGAGVVESASRSAGGLDSQIRKLGIAVAAPPQCPAAVTLAKRHPLASQIPKNF